MKAFDLIVITPDARRERDVVAHGETWEDAARDYVARNPGHSVIAWRKHRGSPVTVLGRGHIID